MKKIEHFRQRRMMEQSLKGGEREREMEELGAKGCSSEEERAGERAGDTRQKGFSQNR
jgi:hypothetical protein